MSSSSSSSEWEEVGALSDLRSAEVSGPREEEEEAGAANLEEEENCWERNTCCGWAWGWWYAAY
jgi:hypothetical protein